MVSGLSLRWFWASAVSLRRLAASAVFSGHRGGRRCAWCPGSSGGACGACGPDPCHGACLALSLPSAQGRSQPSSRTSAGLSVTSCPVAALDRSASSCRHSCSSGSATGPVEARSAAGVARSSAPSEPRDALSDPVKQGNAGGTSTAVGCDRAVPCGLAAPTPLLMTASTTRTTTRCFCSATPPAAPHLLSRLSALDELSLALTSQFALDIFTIIQQDYPEASDDHTLPDLGLEDLA